MSKNRLAVKKLTMDITQKVSTSPKVMENKKIQGFRPFFKSKELFLIDFVI